jgi:Protein of unknown function (DUF2971)
MNPDHSACLDSCGGTKPRPRILYIYRSINDHLRDALIQKHLWASNPLSFNDPFDCTIPALNSASPKEATECVEHLLSIGNFSPQHQALARQEATQGRLVYPERLEMAWRRTLGNTGVICFTERPDNILMWAHYASKHEGICLGFEGVPERLDVQRVEYAKTLPPLRLADLLPPKDLEASEARLKSKSCHWAYEREWRFILSETKFSSDSDPRRRVPFAAKELRRVIFGCRTSVERRQEMILLLEDWPTKIHFYEAVPHSSRFAISIRRLKV